MERHDTPYDNRHWNRYYDGIQGRTCDFGVRIDLFTNAEGWVVGSMANYRICHTSVPRFDLFPNRYNQFWTIPQFYSFHVITVQSSNKSEINVSWFMCKGNKMLAPDLREIEVLPSLPIRRMLRINMKCQYSVYSQCNVLLTERKVEASARIEHWLHGRSSEGERCQELVSLHRNTHVTHVFKLD